MEDYVKAVALKYRKKHPDKNLRVMFWPKKFLEAFRGIQNYDPYFLSKRGQFMDELLNGYTKNETLDDVIDVISKA